MPVSQHSSVAKEGMPLLIAVIVGALVLQMLYGSITWPAWLVVVVVGWLLRDPQRATPASPLGIVAPVDGKIIAVDICKDPYLSSESLKISIRMPLTGTFTLRSVTEGNIIQHWMGETIPHGTGHAHAVWLQTDEEDDVVLALSPGHFFGRIACYLSTGDRVGQGRRCGYIPLGAQLDIYLPVDSPARVKVGDKVFGGESLIAQFVHRTPISD
ncbi:hypothetical protein MNBD_GAMMA25-1729 [hydrothermal vent metagenome]|uniref:Phosphatidylserine decarboxylase n=1 Tax=hydrothermal vent metagenome TaxID=652676 RepID=A0A3B1AYY7_9ZZZZ